MRRTAFSIVLAAEMFVLGGTATAQNTNQPVNPPRPTPPAQPVPSDRTPDRVMDPAERERMQKEWDTLKKEWDALTPEARLLSVIHTKNLKEVELGRLGQERGSSQGVKEYAAMMVKDHTEADSKLNTLATSEKITLWDTARTERALKLKKMFGKDKDADKDKDKDKERKDRDNRDPNKPAHPEDRKPGMDKPGHDKPMSPGHDANPPHDGKKDDWKDPAEKLRTLTGDEFDNAFARVMHKGHAELLHMLEKGQPELTNANVKNYVSEVTSTVRRHRDNASGLPGAGGKDGDKPMKDDMNPPRTPPKDPAVKDPKWDR